MDPLPNIDKCDSNHSTIVVLIPDSAIQSIKRKRSFKLKKRSLSLLVLFLLVASITVVTCYLEIFENSSINQKVDHKFMAFANASPIVVNAASTASLGSSDCPDVPNQTLANMGHLAGAPKGPDGAVPCGKKMTLLKDGKSTTVTIAWQATGVFSGNPNNEPYVEIFPEAYTELTGKAVIDGVFWQTGVIEGDCSGTCNVANGVPGG